MNQEQQIKLELQTFITKNPLILNTGTEYYKTELHDTFWKYSSIATQALDTVIKELQTEKVEKFASNMALIIAMNNWNDTSNLMN